MITLEFQNTNVKCSIGCTPNWTEEIVFGNLIENEIR